MQTPNIIKRVGFLLLFIGVAYVFITVVQKVLLPPTTFPVPYQITINNGQTLFSISKELSDDGVIKNRRVFEMFVMTFGNESHISEGEYFFEKPVSVIEVAMRIAGRQFGVAKRKVTFPEGFSNKEMATRLTETFDSFDTALFLSLSKNQEGYLFPDTYGFFPSTTPDVIVTALRKNFDKKIESLRPQIDSSKRSLSDIIIMASIIEKEARGENDRELVSGILWNRIDAGIPLQVDAPFIYLLGKESKELTRADLATKSLYNTYIHKGFPPTPINNPGIAAIEAALKPEISPYFYYLHDEDGTIHYAKTYTEHKANIRKYLR
ncbi:MAG: endolytic transglycosylase MltG [Patescibacteria group bacterium]